MLRSITRFVTLASLFLIPLLPLVVVDSFFFPFITGKALYFRVLVEIAFAAWIILAFLDARYRPRLNALTIGVTVFALVTLIADLVGANPLRSLWSNFERMEGWMTIIHLWMFYIVMASVLGSSSTGEEGDKRWWHYWMNAFLLVGLVIGGYGFVQLLGWADIHQGSVRIDASLGNAAYMAVYMLMNAGLAAYLFFVTRGRGRGYVSMQWVYGILFVIFSFLLFETATRGTILGFIGGVMLALFLYAVLGKGQPKRQRWWAIATIGIIVLIGAVFWLNRDAQFVRDSEVLSRLSSISFRDTQTQARAYVWPMALTGWTQRPILGWGQENFNYIFNANYNPHMWVHEQWFDRAHSVFLDWLVASGIVGFISYVSLYVLALSAIWRGSRSGTRPGLSITEKCALTGLVVGYAVHNIFVFDNLSSYMAFFAFLAFAGSALSVAGGGRRGGPTEVPVLGGKREINPEKVAYVIVPVSAVILIVCLYFFNIRVATANTRLITALQSCFGQTPDPTLFEKVFSSGTYVANQEAREQLLNCTPSVIQNDKISPQTKQAFYEMAQKGIDDQIVAAPKDARMYLLGGAFLNNVQQFDRSRQLLEKAQLLTPGKQSVKIELARNHLNVENIDEAVTYLKAAYESDPTYGIARGYYSLGLIIAGKEELARTIFADDPALFETQQVADLYVSLGQYAKSAALYKKLVAKDPTNLDLRVRLAQVQYSAGMKTEALATLRAIQKDHPDLKDEVETLIKQLGQ